VACCGECTIREYEVLGGGSNAYSGSPDPGTKQWDEWLKDLKAKADSYLKKPPTGCAGKEPEKDKEKDKEQEKEQCQCVKCPADQDPKWSDKTSILFQKKFELAGHQYQVSTTYNVKFRDFAGKCGPAIVDFPQ